MPYIRGLTVIGAYRDIVCYDCRMSSSHDATVRLWCRQSHLVLKILHIHRGPILSMCFDGTHILTGSSDKWVEYRSPLWDALIWGKVKIYLHLTHSKKHKIIHKLSVISQHQVDTSRWNPSLRKTSEIEPDMKLRTLSIGGIPLVQGRTPKFGQKMQNTLVKILINYWLDWPWLSRSNITF